jgi:uncharacterized DUF497 family protein
VAIRTFARVSDPWDPKKAEANLRKHEVGFPEAMTVDDDEFRLTHRDLAHSAGEPRFNVIGLSAKGRILFVVCTYRRGRMRPISARRATKRERHGYLNGTR